MRLDQLLLHKKLARSRSQSQKLISAGLVSVREGGAWLVVKKVSASYSEMTELKVEAGDEQKYVSRAGLKLAGALAAFHYSPEKHVCLDVGQSTGGFTDCLLQHGATKVVGVDVGKQQLDPSLRGDSRVVCLEGINARALPHALLQEHATIKRFAATKKNPKSLGVFDLIVMDVSFISQTLIIPELPCVLKDGGHFISLVKPQFEVGPQGIGKGGIVKNEALFADVEKAIRQTVENHGMCVKGFIESPLLGGDGNKEFFLYAQKPKNEYLK